MTTYEPVIGLEVHAQLKTQSKLFCACGTKFGLPANTQTCPICLGMPGTLPVVNRRAVEMAIQTGLALHCTINVTNRFARKNYFYPDLPKGYQISQYESPICENGWVEIAVGGDKKTVRIRRAHLEEDAGKSVHETGTNASRVDLNRAGTPLLEIVTEPDMRSADEVIAYLRTLRDILIYLDVCDGNMEEGSLRCEPNLSLRPVGQQALGTKVELKNINSFKFVKEAIEYEIKRQTKVLKEGGRIHQETRLWDTDRGETVVMRSKEEAHDYRYFPDPDLVPLEISREWIEELRKTLPRLATEVHRQFTGEYGLTDYAAGVLTADKDAADYFERAAAAGVQAGLPPVEGGRELANWTTGDLRALLNDTGLGFAECPVKPDQLAELVLRKHRGEISGPIAKTVLTEMFRTGKRADEIIAAKGLTQVSDEGVLGAIIDDVVARNPQQVAQYKAGKEAVFGFFVGQVMKATGGKANPGKVNELLKKTLAR
jgi:aspartyl-tRNA(Asn)/glutamyl-tRNA(Gln) amidotransferase subunit B